MSALEIYLWPGRFLLELFFHEYLGRIEPELVTIFAAFIAWIIWAGMIRIAWAITLRLFGFDRRRAY